MVSPFAYNELHKFRSHASWFTRALTQLRSSLYCHSSSFFLSFPLLFTSNRIASSTVDMERRRLISFVVTFDTAAFKAKFNYLELLVKTLLECTAIVPDPAEKDIYGEYGSQGFVEKVCTENFSVPENCEPGTWALETEPIWEVLRVSSVVHTYGLRDFRLWELFFHFFREGNFPVTLLSGVQVLKLVLDNNQAKANIRCEMSVPIVFEAQVYFHAMAMTRRDNWKKRLSFV